MAQLIERRSPTDVEGRSGLTSYCAKIPDPTETAPFRMSQSNFRVGPFPRRLATVHHPVSVVFDLPRLEKAAADAGSELGRRAALDQDRCCGYFPALEGVRGIASDLPASRALASSLPVIRHDGEDFPFNFLRLSLRQQRTDPAYHLDSDAATALSGDVSTLKVRRVTRLLLNLSSEVPRMLHYLDVDPYSVDLVADGSYVRAADPGELVERALTAVIPARNGPHVAGLLFVANRLLHSGVDDEGGHFVAAYGIDAIDDAAASGCPR